MALPYPAPADNDVTLRMSRNRRRDTRPELLLRRRLHAEGLRFRVDYPVDTGEIRVRPDIVFTRRRLAVFVDGCFWHGCPQHGNVPARNQSYWVPKFERNRARDRVVTEGLIRAGWSVIRVWEHEPIPDVTETIIQLLGEVSARDPEGRTAAVSGAWPDDAEDRFAHLPPIAVQPPPGQGFDRC